MELVDHFVMTIAAPRRSGKSYLIKHMLKIIIDDFDFVKILCPSLDFNDDYDEFKERKHVELLSHPDRFFIENLIQQHETCSAQVKGRDDIECPRTLVIFDDCVDSNILSFKGIVDRIAERGRHINISAIISSQRLTAISRSVRLNSDYFIIFAPAAVAELEKFLEEFIFRCQRRELMDLLHNIFEVQYTFLICDATEKRWDAKLKHSNTEDYIQGIEYPIVFSQKGPKDEVKKRDRPAPTVSDDEYEE